MNDLKDLELLIRSGIPLLFIETREERRVDALSQRLAARLGRRLYRWSVATGLRVGDELRPAAGSQTSPDAVLQHILRQSEPGLYLLFDIHPWLDRPLTVRLMREIAQNHERVPHTLVLVGPTLETPPELRATAARYNLSLPSRDRLAELIEEESARWGRQHRKRAQGTRAVIDRMVDNLLGVGLVDARRLIRHAVHDDGILNEDDLDAIKKAKFDLLDAGSVLSLEMDSSRFEDVAGLSRMKTWLANRRAIFLSDDAPAGLDPPKGLLLLGVQGGGKSLAAKSIAGAWGVPLLRLDFATLYNKYYGETERNLREALATAEVMQPCVLWIDEIEKGLSTDRQDGGPSQRILGTLLTWMAERDSKVFLVATANDIGALPPELLRKGRFDEIFFVDLPSPQVRAVIFHIHLKKRDQSPESFDLDALAKASEGFAGAEIEQAVVSALYTAHANTARLTTDHIIEALGQTRPLSVLMAEKIQYLRNWAARRTVPAD